MPHDRCSAQRKRQQDSSNVAVQLVLSGFQNVIRDGRTSPLAPFASSAGAKRTLNHSSSHGSLGAELNALSRSPRDTFPRSWGRVEGQQAFGKAQAAQAHQLARSLPKQTEEALGGKGSYHSSKYGGDRASQHSGGHSSFKLPANLRGKTATGAATSSKQRPANPHRSSGRPLPIEEEHSVAGTDKHSRILGDRKDREKEKAAKKEERRKLARSLDPNTTRKAIGAAMRLDRGRAAAPAVDPIEWIANVRLEKENLSEDQTGGETSQNRDSDGVISSRLATSKIGRAGVAFGREGLTTEDETDAERVSPLKAWVMRSLASIVNFHALFSKRSSLRTHVRPYHVRSLGRPRAGVLAHQDQVPRELSSSSTAFRSREERQHQSQDAVLSATRIDETFEKGIAIGTAVFGDLRKILDWRADQVA